MLQAPEGFKDEPSYRSPLSKRLLSRTCTWQCVRWPDNKSSDKEAHVTRKRDWSRVPMDLWDFVTERGQLVWRHSRPRNLGKPRYGNGTVLHSSRNSVKVNHLQKRYVIGWLFIGVSFTKCEICIPPFRYCRMQMLVRHCIQCWVLGQCFLNFDTCLSHLGIMLTCKLYFRRSGENPETLHF